MAVIVTSNPSNSCHLPGMQEIITKEKMVQRREGREEGRKEREGQKGRQAINHWQRVILVRCSKDDPLISR